MLRVRTRPLQNLNSARRSAFSSYPRLQSSANIQARQIARNQVKGGSKNANRNKTIPLDDVFDGLDANALGFGRQTRNGHRSHIQHALKKNSSTKKTRLGSTSKSSKVLKKESASLHPEDLQLFTEEHIRHVYEGRIPEIVDQGLKESPSKSPKTFFRDLDLTITVKFKVLKTRRSGRQFECSLIISVEENTIEAKGHSANKGSAEDNAYLHAICKLEELGLFKEMSPGGKYNHTQWSNSELQVESNAQVDVINLAARHGCQPIFHTKKRQGAITRQKLFRSHVSIPELDLEGYGKGFTAELAIKNACISIKKNAEARHAETGTSSILIQDFEHLTMDTADKFVRLVAFKEKLSIEVLTDEKNSLWTGTLNLVPRKALSFSETTPESSYSIKGTAMLLKTQAESAAFLAAGLDLKDQFPEVWTEFSREIQRGKGDVLKALSPIDIGVGHTAVGILTETMQTIAAVNRNKDVTDTITPIDARSQRRTNNSRQLDPYMIKQKNEALLRRLVFYEMDPKTADLREKRSQLPMVQHAHDVLKLVNDNEFCVVVGATGSGKTTQLPQLILEEMTRTSTGGTCNIICTQPRRIAATSVARRVAAERNEPLGLSVGYAVRFDAKLPLFGGSINYCTTGILLRQLQDSQDTTLDGISHIIIDEVHERDLQIDFLLLTLKQLMAERKAANKPAIKVIMMSATIDTSLFSKYFGEGSAGKGCPHIEVPGRLFPVAQHFLGEIYTELTKVYAEGQARELYSKESTKYVSTERASESQLALLNQVYDGTSDEDIDARPKIDWHSKGVIGQDGKIEVFEEKEESAVPIGIMSVIIAHILKTTTEGSILVFLPGLQEISALETMLKTTYPLGLDIAKDPNFKIYTLHSAIPQMQQEVFEQLERGRRKIILSTNIAETSITIPDVVYVVDSNKQRENQFDPGRNISSLVSTWTSKSNARQRAGRAGRVQNGHYFSMATKGRYDSFATSMTPEILRVDLKDLCLQVKSLGVSNIWNFLSRAIQPPREANVRNAIEDLKTLQALDNDENMTPLGNLLSTLPLPPTLGKMVVLGAIFQCLDPIILLAAATASRDPFLNPAGMRDHAAMSRADFAQGTQSDHFAFLNAYQQWRELRTQRGYSGPDDKRFAMDNYLHHNTLVNITQSADQIFEVLVNAGIASRPASTSRLDRVRYGTAEENKHSSSLALQAALLTSGLYPNIAVQNNATAPRYLRTPHDNEAAIHVNSVAAPRTQDGKRWGKITWNEASTAGTMFAFSQKTRSDGQEVNLRQLSKVSPLSVVLFGGKVLQRGHNTIEVDNWLPFYVPGRDLMPVIKVVNMTLEKYLADTFAKLGVVQRNMQRGIFDPSTSFHHDKSLQALVSGIVRSLEICAPREFRKGEESIDLKNYGNQGRQGSYSTRFDSLQDKRDRFLDSHTQRQDQSKIIPPFDLRSPQSGAPRMNEMFIPPSRNARSRNAKPPGKNTSQERLEDIFKKWLT